MPKAAKTFTVIPQRVGTRTRWVIARIPFNVEKVFGMRGTVKVKGDINGFAFRTSLFPSRRRGDHIIMINRKMQAGGGVQEGVKARMRLQLDTEKREAVVPRELQKYFSEERALQRWYEKNLSYSIRKSIGDWILESKSAATRERRAEQLAERLYETVEAERELPPPIRTALGRVPGAMQGWQSMTPAQRRWHLLSIFYYRNPESRTRRIEKLVELAAARAEKRR